MGRIGFSVILALVLLASMGLIIMDLMKSGHSTERTIRVVFPFSVLKLDSGLINPANLDSTSEYYLLENLAFGFIRDSADQTREFEPLLAKHWYQVNDRTWALEIDTQRKWSDGTAITPDRLIAHIKKLAHSESRHLIALHHITDVSYDPTSATLLLHFNEPVGNIVLHELSLADSVLLHPKNQQGDWSVTSGPYSVKSIIKDKKQLILRLNPSTKERFPQAPAEVELFGLKSREEISELFSKIPADLFSIPFPSFDPIYGEPKNHAAHTASGVPTTISFFHFNATHAFTHNQEARLEFASLIRTATQEWPADLPSLETEMVPTGYAGRLNDYTPTRRQITHLKGKSFCVNLHPAFKNLDRFERGLKNAAEKNGVHIDIEYKAFTAENTSSPCFAELSIFKGNQKDASGSFSFLFSKGTGPLAAFHDGVRTTLEKISLAQKDQNKSELIRALHREILDRAYAVPLFIEAPLFLTSDAIDLSRWNQFDMRQRYYEIKLVP